MKRLLRQIKWDAVLTSVLYVVLGVVALVAPDTMVKTFGYMIGILLILAGAVSMICYLLRDAHQNYYRNDFGYGLVGIAIGILVLYRVEWIISLVPVTLGILVLVSGCGKLQEVIDMKRMEYGNWVLMLVLAAANVLFGVVLIANPFETVVLLFQLMGAGLIFSGVTDCAVVIYAANKLQKYFEGLKVVDAACAEVEEEQTCSQEEDAPKKDRAEEGRPYGTPERDVQEEAGPEGDGEDKVEGA